jgi:hypothetical protein
LYLETEPIQEAVETAFRLLNDPAARYSLFGRACGLILEEADIIQIQECISEAVAIPYELIVTSLSGSIMQVTPHLGDGPGSHIVRFSTTFTSCSEDDKAAIQRCKFLHIVKILHKVAHTLTPALVRRTEQYKEAKAAAESEGAPFPTLDTLERIGQVWTSKAGVMSDFGSAFEQTVFGGRVVPGKEIGAIYGKPLLLVVTVSSAHDAPYEENVGKFVVSDKRVVEILTALENWQAGSPLPDLNLASEEYSEVAEGGADQGPPRKKARKGGVVTCTEGREESPPSEDEEGEQASSARGPRLTPQQLEELRALGQVLNEDQVRFIKSGKGKI